MNIRFTSRILCGIVTLAAMLAHASTLRAQSDDDMDMLKRFPPKYLNPEMVEIAMDQLQWAVERNKMTADILVNRNAEASVQLEALASDQLGIMKSLPEEFRFADDRARSDAASRCLQELLTIRLELATNRALMEELQSSPLSDIDRTRQELVKRQLHVKLSTRKSDVELAEQQLQRANALAEKNMVSELEIKKAEVELERARADLETEELNMLILQQEAAAPPNRELADIHRQIKALEARENAARDFLRQLNETARLNQQIRRLDENMENGKEALARLALQKLELQIEFDQLHILQNQTREALKNLPPSADGNDDQ